MMRLKVGKPQVHLSPAPESMLCIRLETNGQVSGIQQRRAGKTGRLERLGSDWA